MSVWIAKSPTINRAPGSRIVAANPSRTMASRRSGASSRSSPFSTAATGRTPLTSVADHRRHATVQRKTVCGLVATSSSPPIAGPMNIPIPSIALVVTFAAVSSSGVSVSDGISADSAG